MGRRASVFFVLVCLCLLHVARGETLWWKLEAQASPEERRALLDEVSKLIRPTLHETRTNVERYLGEEGGSPYRWTNVYILNRLYFAVPAKMRAGERILAGWTHGGYPRREPSADDAVIDAIYPLREGPNGFEIHGRIYEYRGNPYPVLREFDEFYLTYGLRAGEHNADVAEQIELLLKAPKWDYQLFEAGGDRELIEALLMAGKLPTPRLRQVISKLMETEDSAPMRNTWFKVYLLNRLAFALPRDAPWRDLPQVLGGLGRPEGINRATWPLLFLEGNQLAVASRSEGYAGPSYQGLREFDAFAARYRRRHLGELTPALWLPPKSKDWMDPHAEPESLRFIRSGDRLYVAEPKKGQVSGYSPSRNKVLWSVNPHGDWTKTEGEYRLPKPTITDFRLIDGKTPGLFVRYSNSRFGVVDLETGGSKCDGQD